MGNSYKTHRVTGNVALADGIYKLTMEGSEPAAPGQFYMMRGWKEYPILARPISVHDCNEDELSFLYEEVGRGTKILSQLKVNDTVDVLGPLGHGFTIEDYRHVAIVSGAVGIAPFLYLAKELHQRGIKVDLYAGFLENSYALETFKPYVNEIFISTDRGTEGFHGNVVELFKETGHGDDYDQIFTCGPNPMIYSLLEVVNPDLAQVSLEAHMACGFGACLGCNIHTNSGEKRVCVHGPVFSGGDIIA